MSSTPDRPTRRISCATGSTCSRASSRSCRGTTSACSSPRPGRRPKAASRPSPSSSGPAVGKVTGFLEIKRKKPPARPVAERVHDWKEYYLSYPVDELTKQAARCMDCGIPFCHQGCPLGNIIPDWNDLVYKGHWREAIDRLHATNNFPEWTGRLCPAPCEGACVLGINDDPVTIKGVELAIIERAFDEGWVGVQPPAVRTGKRVAVVGSGPAGLAAAEQLNRAGHAVTVFERDDRIGGLLRYGIPEFKMEKRFIDRRLQIMEKDGVVFQTNSHVGVNVPVETLRRDFDAIVLAGGACLPRDLPVPGRELRGIHFAMGYLTLSTQRFLGDARGHVRGLEAVRVDMVREGGRLEFKPIPGSEFTLEVDLVLLAMGFLGPERPGMLGDLGVKLTERGNVWRDANWMSSVPGVFACGDMQRGQSLIVWAIAEGRSAARGVDLHLMGKSELPAPLP